MRLSDRFARFMVGRYGVDQLSRSMLILTFILCILSIFIRGRVHALIDLVIFLLIILAYFRMFSRNIYKRAAENEKYLKLTEGIRKKIRTEKKIAGQRKYYHFYTCPGCAQRIRIPKGRGRIEIRCPKCGEKFIKRS